MKLRTDFDYKVEEIYKFITDEIVENSNKYFSLVNKDDSTLDDDLVNHSVKNEMPIKLNIFDTILLFNFSKTTTDVAYSIAKNGKLIEVIYSSLVDVVDRVNPYNKNELSDFIRDCLISIYNYSRLKKLDN